VKYRDLIILFLMITILTGCVEKEIIDDVNLITALGVDLVEDQKIKGSANIDTYIKDQPVTDRVIVEESKLARELVSNMQKQSPDPLVLGKLQIVLFGESLAKQGLTEMVDTLQRDASIGERLLLVITRGEANAILESDFATLGAAKYLTNLVLQNKLNRDLPRTNLHLFLYQHYSKGQDPFLPIIKKNEKSGSVEIDGLALMNEKKMVGEISNEKLLFFKVLADQYTKGAYTVEMPATGESVGIKSIASSRELKVVSTNPIKVKIKVHIEGYINEFTGKKITPEVTGEVEKAFKEIVEKESLALIEKFKELKIDPIGIGDDLRSQSRAFLIDEWRDRIPELEVDLEADVVITESGVID